MIKGSQRVIRRVFWSWLVTFLVPPIAHANTLTKLRVVESHSSSQLILSVTHSSTYTVMPWLNQQRLVIYLPNTIAQPHYPKHAFTGPLIEDIEVSQDASWSHTDGLESGVKVEVALKTSEVSFSHQPLDKPTGILLVLRKMKSPTNGGDADGSQLEAKNSVDQAPVTQETRRQVQTAESVLTNSLRHRPQAAPEATDPASSADQHADRPFMPQPPAAMPEKHGTWPLRQAGSLPREHVGVSSLPPAEELQGVMGQATSAQALTLLELYFQNPTAFSTNPSLLWSVAAAYGDLGLYEEAYTLYSRIAEQTDNPLLQAAALVKRGKLVLLRGEWELAEKLLRQFVTNHRYAPLLAEAYEALADALAAQGKFAEAVHGYHDTLVHTPEAQKPPAVFYKLGQAQGKLGNWPQAVEAFRKAADYLQVHTASIPEPAAVRSSLYLETATFQQLGDSLYKTQQFQEAAVAYRQVVQRAPADWQTGWALYQLGQSYGELRGNDMAWQAYQALTRQPDPFWAEIGHRALATSRWRAR